MGTNFIKISKILVFVIHDSVTLFLNPTLKIMWFFRKFFIPQILKIIFFHTSGGNYSYLQTWNSYLEPDTSTGLIEIRAYTVYWRKLKSNTYLKYSFKIVYLCSLISPAQRPKNRDFRINTIFHMIFWELEMILMKSDQEERSNIP